MATPTTFLPPNRQNPLQSLATSPATAFSKPLDRVRPYKDFLTPALHRRFTRSALLLIAVCYLESLLISPPSLLWVWNPISFAGARAFLLFCPCLSIFIIRVTNIHVGKRTSLSSAETAYNELTNFCTLHTVTWYLWSAWFFGELYIWSRASSAHLAWIDPGAADERARLNENPIFLRSFLSCLGAAQAALHLIRNYDRVPMLEQEKQDTPLLKSSRLPDSVNFLLSSLPRIGARVLKLTLPGLILTTPLYFAFIRHLVWPFFYYIGRTLNDDLPPSASPTGVGVDHIFLLAWQAISSGVLLTFLWEISNTVFTFYVSQPPLKKEQPLTSEIQDAQGVVVSKSKDPNDSLLNGLKSKKEIPRSFAFWELWLICSNFDTRRKTIYMEVDRKDGSTWTQILKLCLDEVEAIKERIAQANQPAKAEKEAQAKDLQRKQQENLIAPETTEPFGMPKIADRKVLDGDVWQNSKPTDFAQSMGSIAKGLGQSGRGSNTLAPGARRALEWSRDRIMSKEDQERLSRKALTADANSLAVRFLKTPFGEPFRQTLRRTVYRVLFGGPNSRKTTITFAVRSLVRLAICSLKEDDYGQVAKSISQILRTFTTTINEINTFTATFQPDWTDVNFAPNDRSKISEAAEVVVVLRTGLEELLLAFGEYAAAINVTRLELRQAREAVGKGSEMRKV